MLKYTHYIIKVLIAIFMSFFALFGFVAHKAKTPIIEHLAFNTLISFPEKALSQQNNLSQLYDETKITPSEFKKILEELYKNNYILVGTNILYNTNNNSISLNKLNIPQNKKPIILSFDNVSYKSSYKNLGQIDKIIIDRNNKFATYTTKRNIQDRVMHDNEFLPLLEDFVDTHPDFSHNGAKGIIFLTGENGILGYETNQNNTSGRHEKKRVSEIINKLKVNGWNLGCNNYKFKPDHSVSELEFVKNINLWNKEIKPLIGDTELYSFPHGELCNDESKLYTLKNNGFRFLFYNNMRQNLSIQNNCIFMSRKPVNGSTLRNNCKDFDHLFNCEYVYDHEYRTIPFNSISL